MPTTIEGFVHKETSVVMFVTLTTANWFNSCRPHVTDIDLSRVRHETIVHLIGFRITVKYSPKLAKFRKFYVEKRHLCSQMTTIFLKNELFGCMTRML